VCRKGEKWGWGKKRKKRAERGSVNGASKRRLLIEGKKEESGSLRSGLEMAFGGGKRKKKRRSAGKENVFFGKENGGKKQQRGGEPASF